ncbi:uncharacterized protein LOC122327494 isoform X4 [Puntigrus tetrazona]|uniref:uncharacterized protein LOC122327494 isoform X4 n=1 Tax=Puntigrus tetrazona TaxID=1606681 RepID=UPI001C8AD5E1|nr:uncharacterized protein LOC122327494 isoform X4 [Puntigrus tetrazona]
MSEISTKLAEDCEKELPDVLEHHQTSRISEKLKEMLKDSKRLKELSKHCEKELCKISDRLKEMSSKKKGQNSEQETPLVDAMINEDQETGDEGEKKGPVIMKTLL